MTQTLLSNEEVAEVARGALEKVLPKTKIDRIEVGGDEFGFDPGIRITVVISKGSSVQLTGKQLGKMQEEISSELWKRGEERFPYLRYLTTSEMKQLAS